MLKLILSSTQPVLSLYGFDKNMHVLSICVFVLWVDELMSHSTDFSRNIHLFHSQLFVEVINYKVLFNFFTSSRCNKFCAGFRHKRLCNMFYSRRVANHLPGVETMLAYKAAQGEKHAYVAAFERDYWSIKLEFVIEGFMDVL